MPQYIDKSAVVAEIEKRRSIAAGWDISSTGVNDAEFELWNNFLAFLDTLEVKEVELDIEKRIKECPFRQVGCTMYEGRILECKGACSWVVDYPKLKELKAQKGEDV